MARLFVVVIAIIVVVVRASHDFIHLMRVAACFYARMLTPVCSAEHPDTPPSLAFACQVAPMMEMVKFLSDNYRKVRTAASDVFPFLPDLVAFMLPLVLGVYAVPCCYHCLFSMAGCKPTCDAASDSSCAKLVHTHMNHALRCPIQLSKQARNLQGEIQPTMKQV